ncbi:MAG: 16S rRNA (cytidine(1402)-2'-O)-methyltransferase [Candidatus Binataceae bacterium]
MSPAADKQVAATGCLRVVATPIGNPGDLSARAILTLREADLIACEDTRRTGRMLAGLGIATPTISYFEHNEERRIPELIERLRAGAKIALVTDAGTPAISDPGFKLVRAAIEAGARVEAVPGASAAIAALSVAGIATNRFAFEGFLPPRGAARRKALEALRAEPRTMVFYEAARRLAPTLEEMTAVFGESRSGAVLREITKTYEEIARGGLGELARRYRANPALGEVTIVVEGAPLEPTSTSAHPVTIEPLRGLGLSLKQASAVLALLTGRPRREIYNEALKSRDSESCGNK